MCRPKAGGDTVVFNLKNLIYIRRAKKNMTREITGKLKEAKKFSKDISYIRCHAIMFKDEHGQVIYTFSSKKKADEFFEVLTKTKTKNIRKEPCDCGCITGQVAKIKRRGIV